MQTLHLRTTNLLIVYWYYIEQFTDLTKLLLHNDLVFGVFFDVKRKFRQVSLYWTRSEKPVCNSLIEIMPFHCPLPLLLSVWQLTYHWHLGSPTDGLLLLHSIWFYHMLVPSPLLGQTSQALHFSQSAIRITEQKGSAYITARWKSKRFTQPHFWDLKTSAFWNITWKSGKRWRQVFHIHP